MNVYNIAEASKSKFYTEILDRLNYIACTFKLFKVKIGQI